MYDVPLKQNVYHKNATAYRFTTTIYIIIRLLNLFVQYGWSIGDIAMAMGKLEHAQLLQSFASHTSAESIHKAVRLHIVVVHMSSSILHVRVFRCLSCSPRFASR